MFSPRYDEAPRFQGYATYSPPVDQAGREVGGLLHEGRVGGALHDPRHVLDDRLVVVAQDLEQ